jgi:hypothetical protein
MSVKFLSLIIFCLSVLASDFEKRITLADGEFRVVISFEDSKVMVKKSRAGRSYLLEIDEVLFGEESLSSFLPAPSDPGLSSKHLGLLENMKDHINGLLIKGMVDENWENSIKDAFEVGKVALTSMNELQYDPCEHYREESVDQSDRQHILEHYLSEFPGLPLGTHFRIDDELFYLNQQGDIFELVFKNNLIDKEMLDQMDASGDAQSLIGTFSFKLAFLLNP